MWWSMVWCSGRGPVVAPERIGANAQCRVTRPPVAIHRRSVSIFAGESGLRVCVGGMTTSASVDVMRRSISLASGSAMSRTFVSDRG